MRDGRVWRRLDTLGAGAAEVVDSWSSWAADKTLHAREEICELACELAGERNLVQLEVTGGLEKCRHEGRVSHANMKTKVGGWPSCNADSFCMGKAMHVRSAKESMHSSCP